MPSAVQNIVEQCANDREFQQLPQHTGTALGHAGYLGSRLRIQNHDLAEQRILHIAGHDDKRRSVAGSNDICLLSDDISDKIRDQLHIEIVCIGDLRFIGFAAAQQI